MKNTIKNSVQIKLEDNDLYFQDIMAKNERSNYQKNVISGYYEHLDSIMLTKLGELVTELFLAETDAKKNQLWKRAEKAMTKLKIKPAVLDHIMAKKDVQILAKNLNDWLKLQKKK